jgi:hypothetical protein
VPTLPAHLVATPVLERLTGARDGAAPAGPTGALEGVVLGAGATAAWVDVGGFVVAITTREVPLLPNAIALSAGSGALSRPVAAPGATAWLTAGRVTLGSLQITWDPAAPPTWDPTVPVPTGATPEALAARGAAILRALGSRPTPRANPNALVRELARAGVVTAADPDGAAGLTLLLRAVRERDPEPAAAATRELLGRGPGLTPEGDDLLAAVAGTLAVLSPAIGLPGAARLPPTDGPARDPLPDRLTRDPPPDRSTGDRPLERSTRRVPPDGPERDPLLAALAPIPGRTTALSRTLLALALRRRLPEPAGRLLDFSPAGEAAWPAALARLERLGHGSGRAYAAGIAATASLLATPRG